MIVKLYNVFFEKIEERKTKTEKRNHFYFFAMDAQKSHTQLGRKKLNHKKIDANQKKK